MVDKTEQKIMGAALNLFAKYGYKGATTRAIAEESGFNELTLFRRFKTKENLFNVVLTWNIEKIKEDLDSKLSSNTSKDPDEFLRTLIVDVSEIADDNAEFLQLTNYEENETTDSLKAQFVEYLSRYIEKRIPDKDIDYNAFALSLFANTFIISQTKLQEQEWFNHDKALEGLIKNSLVLIH
ncbi:MAG TPA: TetR/AcrR family transcriptional regulator [Methanobacterium sp.]|nr:TetR/AcrR family transcriptional regulator [Methanobacterium sp.]